MLSRLVGLLALLALMAIGGLVCLLAVVVHTETWRLDGAVVPWGLVLGLGTSVAVGVAAGMLGVGPAGAVSYVIGWGAITVLVLNGRPEGDFAVASDGLGWGFLGGGLAAMALVLISSLTSSPGHPQSSRGRAGSARRIDR